MPRPVLVFEPVQVALPSEEVARRLADAIRTGFFPLGSRLPSERALAEQMQVSRPTIREALRRLVDDEILSVKAGAGGGAFVISEIVPLDFLVTMPEMRPGEVDEALEVRRVILPWVAQVAARYATDDDFDQMSEALAFGRASLPPEMATIRAQDTHSVIIATMRFDLSVARATRNRLLVRLMESLLRWVEPLRFSTLQDYKSLVNALDLAEAMMHAIRSGDEKHVDKATQNRLCILETALETQSGRRLRRKSRNVLIMVGKVVMWLLSGERADAYSGSPIWRGRPGSRSLPWQPAEPVVGADRHVRLRG